MGDLLRNDPIHMSHFPANLNYRIREQSREPGRGGSRISTRRLENVLECFVRMPPTTMEEGEVLLEALVEEVAAQVIGCSGTKKKKKP